MNKVYPLTAGLGSLAIIAFDFVRSTIRDARSDRHVPQPTPRPTPVDSLGLIEEDMMRETIVAPTV